jgi:hypothetical protein
MAVILVVPGWVTDALGTKEARMDEHVKLDIAVVKAELAAHGAAFATDVRVEPNKLGNHEIVVIEVRYHDISFEDLVKVSKALGTTRINLDSQTREGGFCETCRYSYSITVLTVWDVRLPVN